MSCNTAILEVCKIALALWLRLMRATALQEEKQTLLDTPEDGQWGRNM
jgi:hypothetical protein